MRTSCDKSEKSRQTSSLADPVKFGTTLAILSIYARLLNFRGSQGASSHKSHVEEENQ